MYVYSCEYCNFTFSRVSVQEQCPRCGKYCLRPATEEEVKAFKKSVEAANHHKS